jgi:hypothetical protein
MGFNSAFKGLAVKYIPSSLCVIVNQYERIQNNSAETKFTRAHTSFEFITRSLIFLQFTEYLSVFYVIQIFQGLW